MYVTTNSGSWEWENAEPSKIQDDLNNNQSLFLIGGSVNSPALRMCCGCQHCGNMVYCVRNCAEYQNIIGKMYR